ncbi:Extracellular matrix-binding protein ebh precursor [Lactobacillus johnsonii]|nr:Extracellular matrix-binding protein ebh precursor [Lactobacillus johnsonii]
MVSKNNIEMKYKKMRDEKQRFSIRKFSVGAASVLIGLSFSLYNGQQASADTVDNGNKSVVANAHDKEQTDNKQSTDTNTQNNEDKTNTNQAQSTVTNDLDHSTVVASYKADTPNNASEVNNSSENTESKSDEKQAATTETAKTEEAATKEAETKNNATNDVAKKNDEAVAKTDTNADVNKTVVENVKTEAATPNVDTKTTETQTVKTDEEKVADTNTSSDLNKSVTDRTTEVSTNTFNVNDAVKNASFLSARAATESKVATRALAAEAEDPNAVTVSDAKGFINAIQNGTATTINVANDLNLASEYDGNYRQRVISHKRDILIQSATPGVKHTIDFSGNSFSMNTQNSVTFKDLDLYERSYWGIVYNAGGYVFDNVNFAGSQLIYTESSINSTLTFKNNVTATAVGSYTSPIDGESRSSQGGNTQQILQFVGGTNHIIFDENSNVTLGTTNSNVLEIDGGTATIDVKNGANVTINPHSKGNPENRNGIRTGSIARAIASNANTTINVDKGANLTINTEKASGDSDVAGALYLNSDATLNVNGDLNINSNGTPSTKNNGYPVYIAGNAAINVGNGGKFNLSATNTGSYSDNLMSISGKGTVKLAPHSNFKISADGTGALTAINLSSGSTFTSDQPDSFTIDLSANTSTGKSLIKNGTINFSRVKTVATDGTTSEPLGKIDVTYDRNGNAKTYTITSLNEDTVKQVGEGLANKNLINLVKAGEDVTLSNLHLSKNNVLTGTVASSGSDNPIYVTVTVGGVSTNVPVLDYYTVYTNTNTNTNGTVTSNNVDYAAKTASTGGDFSINLSKLASSLTDDTQVKVTATKDFVEAAQTESVAALRALNTTTLQELVAAAPDEEKKASYYNASEEAQKAYTDAISTGKTILANQNNYDQVDVDNAVTAIQKAQKALTGEPTNKTKLQDAINQASTVESSDNYTNADADLQKAYTDAISAGQTVLNKENVTQSEVDNALTTINNAKEALNGDAKKAASKAALQKAVDEAPTVKSDDAAYYNGSAEAKTAYDDAISAGQTVLDNPDATATQITDALNAINTAKGNLKGEATDKAALQTAVDNSATVKESNNYTNADQTQKTAYDNAVTAAQTVLGKTNATQAEVNQALQDLETANNNLNGDAKTEAANKAALEAAVKDAPNVRNTPAYYNGSEEAQTAYNSAINAGQAVLDQANPSANDVKTALDAINAAKDNLKGKATNTEALETALTNANNAKETGNYTNADQANQEALNNAIIAGQEILKNTSATQAQVDSAAKAITDAISGLNGDTNLTNAKNAATEDIKKTLDTKTTEITDATNIDQATKDQLIADAKKAAEDANTAINQATDPNAVNTAKTEGITNINNVTVPSLDKAKEAANQAIDQALDTKTKEINNAENIDQTTKDKLIKAATDAANTAKDAIEKSTTNDEATKAGQAGVDAITNVKVPSVTDSQNAAKAAIDDALNAKTKEINDANNIDQTTKDQLIKEATDAANNAKEAIDQATTADAIKTAQDEGTTNINNVTVPSLEDAKKAANKAVDEALTAQTEVINKADNLSDAEKKDLIDKATAEANKAKENIETATTNNEAAQAGQAGVDAIKNIVPTSLDTVKSDANKAIDDALTKKLEEINSANNLTTDEKTALTQEANTAADKAKEEITNATTNDVVIEAQNNGVSAIDGIKVPTESAVKEAAKKAVADAATAKNNAIDASNLTNEEKAALKQKVTDAQNAADQAIDNATTNAAVTEAQTNGIKAINGIEVTTSTVKEAAKKAVADAATAKNNAIDASNLTDEEKAALKQKVTDAQNAADQAIDNATTNVAVTEAQTNGVNAINGIEVPTTSATKEHAITDLNAAVDDAKKAIDQDSNLTDEEKQAAKDQIDRDATKAQEAINNAKTNDDVKKAGDAGTLAIDKDVANAAIDNAVAGKKAEISKTPLTDEEKTALNNEVDQKAQEAKEAINNATTPEAVTTAQDSGVNNINETSVPSESAAKQAAKEAVAKAVDEKNAAIDSSNLTEEEKAALKQKVTEAQTAADQAIDNATTNAGVTEAQTNGVNAINGIEVPNKSDAKEQAITDLNTAVDNAKKAIDQDSNLTDEEKQAAKDQIDSDAKNAQDAINNAKTNDDVKKAADDGTLAIDKDVANAAIDNAVAGKKAEISNSSLTDEEKTALNNEVDQKANSAKDAINNATTPEAVTTAQGNGIKNINATSVPTTSTAKEAAKKAVAEAAEAKNSAIDSSNLTDEEKAALKQKVTEAQNGADHAIDNATTNAAVTEAKDNGISAIDGIEVPITSATKEQAITDLNTAVDDAKKAIDQDNNLTDEQKQAAKDQIDSDAKTAQDAINNAKTDNDVNNAVNSGKVAINKDVANAAIDNAVAGKLKEIQDPLTTEEKQAYTDLINSEATNAKQNIANATTVEEVTTAQTNGVNEITNTEIPTTSSAKEKAIAAINDALQTKTDEINNASNINTQEKTDLINQATEAANAAKNNINNATTNADVDTAQTKGEKAIADVTVPNLSDVKKESIDLINKALDAKTNEINNASNLSQDEKQGLINDATNAATEAINNINQAQTNDDAKAAATTGVQNIENITIPTLDEAKKNANQAIDDALNSKVNEINNASNLNETEKQKLVDQANEAATTAKNNVEKATTNDDARDAANAGIDNIKGITFTSLEDAKNAANTAIDNALQVKTDEINNASNLSTDEKQDLINQATEAANAAKNNINNATTNDAVTEAQNKGIADIANVTVPSLDQVKQDAINAIKQVQDAKNKQISAASNLSTEEQKELSDQVDKIANDAIAKINDSSTTTNDAVTATRDDAIKQITDLFIPTLDGAQTDALNAIESAKNAKLNDINNAAHLTDEEKQALVDQTNKVADDATKEIKAAQTNDAVKSAETAGLENINNIAIPTLVQKQQEAIEELNAARDAKNSAIDNATDLTTDEKNSLKDKVQAEYSNAVSNITSATTDEAVTTAKENGIAAIKDIQIPTKSPAKEQATTDLNAAVDDAKKAIDQDNNLTDEEKQAAKDQIDSDAKKAQEAIDNATTDDEVNSAVDNGKLAIDKDIANAAIDNAVAGKKAEISKSSLTSEEKADLNNEVDQKAKDAKEAIKAATTPETVTTAQENGIKNINDTKVPTESAAKEAAKKAVAEAAEAKNNAIDSSDLTNEEKAALKQEVADAQNAADRAIDAAITNTAVTEAQDNGIKAIDNVTVPTESAAKEAAKKAVAEAADAKNKAIDSSNLTDEEKAALKQEVSDAQNAANTAIDNATTNAAVTQAQNNGIDKINSIEVSDKSAAKDQATTDLNNAVDEAKKAIDQDSNLTDEEKQVAKDQIDSDAKKAQDAINNAKTNDDVKNAVDDGKLAIDKDIANAAIDNAVAGKKAEISNSPLTDEEKAALNNEVDQKAQAAKESINNATTPEAVISAQESGIKNINDTEVPAESAAKQAAKEAVAKVADEKNAAIDSSNLTDEEKAALKQEVTDAQNAANQAIDNATTDAAVTDAEENGIKAINSIEVPTKSTAKDQATTDLNNEVDEAKKAIDQDNNLTDEQKQAAKDQIDSDAKKAQEAIDNAKTNDDVKKAVDDGKLAIDKDVANAAIDDAAAGKLKEINDSLTNEEKQAYTDLINNEADNAKQKINDSTTPEEVTRAQEEGVKNINNINVPTTSPAKDAANAAIDQALKNKKDEINNATNISSEEKTDLINQATEAANIAKDNINNATTNSEVETAQVDGEKAIADVTVPGLSDIKKESIDLINKALNEKQDEINNASNLSQDEKQELIDQAKKIATEAINEINNAQTNDEAKEAADTGVKNIENVSIPSIEDAKKNATQAIDDALNSKKNEINNASNLTDSEKTDLINQATEIAKAAKDAINSATTNTAVEAAEDKGVADINNIHFTNLDDSKKAANSAIEDALNTKKDEINNASNLSDSEKAKLINQATEIAKAAKDAINNATTNAAVTAAENKGIEDIANVNVPSLAETKQAAIDAIKQVQNAKNSQIEEAKNLSADEQKNLIDQVNKIAQDAINKLNDSATTTNEVITDTRDKAIDQITNLFIPTLDSVQKDAQEAINSAKEAKIDEINKADNLTDQMKQNLIDQVDQVADNATKAINNAQTNDDVKEAETKGLEDINSIQVPSLVESKDDAIKEIDDALKKKTDEINAADLDQKQKDELISQITDIATETKTKVFNATTNAEVEAETEAGIKAIEAVKIPARTADKSNTESHESSTNVTPNHNNEENNTAQNTNQVSTKTESESKEQTVITNSVQPKRNAVRHKNGAPVNKKATLPQTGKKDNSNLTLAGAALLGLAGVLSLFGLGDKRKKNK